LEAAGEHTPQKAQILKKQILVATNEAQMPIVTAMLQVDLSKFFHFESINMDDK